ncbi:MAG: tetratricopeptide repeat protein [Burkholderiaceae bacterium]|jgi:predicted O-linked N-acetylglucosamine transferase (SPINDLY family)|nr:tetratricopeptide repeat protein [Burkholderiaceae bacterium]
MNTTEQLQQARQLHDQWQFEPARQAYEKVLEQEPGHAEALHGLGLLLGLHQLRGAEALPYLEAALGVRPKEFSFWRSYIHMLIREGLPDMAVSLIDVARANGMQEIALEQLEKDVALVQGAQAAAFMEEQAARWPLPPEAPAPAARPGVDGRGRVPEAQLGLLSRLFAQREHEQASRLAGELVRQYPRSGLVWKLKAAADNARGASGAALEAARHAARLLPQDAEAHFNLGGICLQQEQVAEAEQAMRQALALRPHWDLAFAYLGDALCAQDRIEDSFPCYVNALLLAPDNVDHLSRLTAALENAGRVQECAQFLVLLMQQQPQDLRLCLASGHVLSRTGWALQAETAYRMALQLAPDHLEALIKLALVLCASGRMAEAETCLRKALVLAPDQVALYCETAFTVFAQKKWQQALDLLEQALRMQPDLARAHMLRCQVLLETNDLPRLDQALTEGLEYLPGNCDLMFQRAAYWDRCGEPVRQMQQLDAMVEQHPGYDLAYSARLFAMIHSPLASAASMGQANRAYGSLMRQRYGGLEFTQHGNARDPGKLLRVGFVSGDLRSHAAAKFFLPVMRELSRCEDLVCVAYCNNEIHDHVTQEFQGLFPLWRGIRDMNVQALAALVQADGIDILIDLSGHTRSHRLDLFAVKPAPVQLTWIGNPGSTGLQTMDYIVLSDLMLDDALVKAQVTEQVMRLPLAYVFDGGIHQEPVAPLPALRNGHLTFGSFNRLSKINREVVAAWGQVLRALPTARLRLGACPPAGPPRHLRDWLVQEGIDSGRVDFVTQMGFDHYLRAHHEIDLCLDTLPFTGGVVTNHALWMGVPTLTLMGELLAGRQSAEVLARVGLAEGFAARDLPQLVEKALYWHNHGPQLQEIRQSLRAQLQALEPRQADIVARSVALGLRQAWQRWCAGQGPADLRVAPADLGLEQPQALAL